MRSYPPIVFAADGDDRVVRFPPPARQQRAGSKFDRARRLLGEALAMAITGPVVGLLAIATLKTFTLLHPAPPPLSGAAVARSMIAPNVPISPVVPLTGVITLPEPPPHSTAADFGAVTPTPDARHMADWVVARADNGPLPFFVIDKRDARLYVFEAAGVLIGSTPVLLGAARGDDSFPGIGDVPIAQVQPWQRTTPAGRFATQPGLDDEHHDVVWVDYEAAVAMHRVVNKVRAERRPERLASPSSLDNRISFGCINVPVPFFDSVVSPLFGKRRGVAYIVPEVRSFQAVFEEHANDSPVMASSAQATQPLAPAAVR